MAPVCCAVRSCYRPPPTAYRPLLLEDAECHRNCQRKDDQPQDERNPLPHATECLPALQIDVVASARFAHDSAAAKPPHRHAVVVEIELLQRPRGYRRRRALAREQRHELALFSGDDRDYSRTHTTLLAQCQQ